MSDSGSSTLSYESPSSDEEPDGRALVGDGIGFPESINYFAPRTLQADQDPAALIPVYLIRRHVGDLIGNVDRLLLRDYHNLKYELKVIAFDGDITGPVLRSIQNGQRNFQMELGLASTILFTDH
ncbi:uncharacterized protein LOC117632896 isoform X3 [Prunus dulcis]|nr:uncharacterized protein LOC117632896 isoform X3 [Prunus dulcis]